MEWLYFHCSLFACMSVCLSVNKIPAERMYAYYFGHSFCYTYMAANCICSDPIEIDYLWSKVKVSVTQYLLIVIILYYHHYCESRLSFVRSKSNLVCRLDMPLIEFYLNLIKLRLVMTLLWRHLCFLKTIVNVSISIEPKNFILDTNLQKHNFKFDIQTASDLDRLWSSQVKVKGTKNEQMIISCKLYTLSHHTRYQGTLQYATSKVIQYDTISWPCRKVQITCQGQRLQTMGCRVLWILLVCLVFLFIVAYVHEQHV